MKSGEFDPRALRTVLVQQTAASLPDIDVVMDAARRATRWPEAALETVEGWVTEEADSINSVDVLGALLMGWRLGGKVPSRSLIQALIDRIERLGMDRLGSDAANTAVLALAPVPEESCGQVAEHVRSILRKAAQHRGALGLQTRAKAVLQDMFGENFESET